MRLTTAKSAGVVAAIPQCDLGEFARLDDDVKCEVLDLLAVVRVCLADQAGALAHLANVAGANGHRRGWSYKTLESKYYAFRATGDWHVLVNKAKQRGLGKSRWMTPAVIEAWKTLCMGHARSYRSAYIELCAEYKAGSRIGDVDWRDVWAEHYELSHLPLPPKPPANMPLPEGWSYKNFLRHQPALIEKLGAREGLNAAKRLSVHVRTTRAGMEPGQQYMFDDLKHDCKVLHEKQLVRVWELACLDVASGHKVAFGLKPNVYDDETQQRVNLRQRDMRLMLAHILINVGYHPDGCELHIENGTASLDKKRYDLLLNELSGGAIRVARAGIDHKVASLAQWGAKGGGNPNAKAHLESSHNLAHNRLDHIPAQTGNNERLNAPEDTGALESLTGKLILASEAMPPELARRLAFPVWDMGLFREAVSEAYKGIATRTEHELEGWDGHMQRQWRASITDDWHGEEEWYALPEAARAGLSALIVREGCHRIARKSPLQVWAQGAAKLVRLPDYAFALLCGKELAEKRPCPATGEVIFVDRTIDPEPMRYRLSSCVDQYGMAVELVEGAAYYWLINPFNPETAFVLGEHGEYVGRVLRQNTVARMDVEAIGREIGRARRDLNERLAPLARRGAKIAKARLADMRNNTEVLAEAGGANALTDEREQAQSAERRAAIRGVSLDDLWRRDRWV
jgi:hypothetical protein